MSKLENKFESFKTAFTRLKEAIDMYENNPHPVLLDGTIQRFEFTVELSWKLIKEYLESEKFGEFNSPKSVIKEAYKVGLLNNGDKWLDMLDDRNSARYAYDESVAKEIYINIIQEHASQFMKLENNMEKVMQMK